MSSQVTCLRCGAQHPSSIAGGMCPHCLLAGLLEAKPAPRLGETAGEAVGPYELVELLGEGGMGSVWRARQLHPVEREVALKIIKLGMDTRELVSRFEAERQSLAVMDHPGIARVHEAGSTGEGRPYFAMELVEGEPVTDYCVSHNLTLEVRLHLFLEICEAVEHAHRKGILHRDLKPSNVLVTETPEGPRPKVIDFGIARILEADHADRTFVTRAGHAVGTPGYMSPEQAGAATDIDTRSDVYSLGALLYEMLTGATPLGRETFREVAHAEVMRLIRETDPPRPSTRVPPGTDSGMAAPLRIDRDLDRIVMKALARERERRYGGATLLGEDVRRFLNHEPVTATDPTLAYRIEKFVRRHRLPVALSALLVLALLTSLVLIERHARRADASALAEREARLATRLALADSYRTAGLAAAAERDDALAALWFTEAGETAAHDPERARANRLRAGLHAGRAPLLVRMIPVGPIPVNFMRFDDTSDFLHAGAQGRSQGFFDLEAGEPIDFGRPLEAACLCGPAQAAVSAPDGFEIHDLRGGGILQSVAVEDPVDALWASADGSLLFVGSEPCRIWNRERQAWQTGPLDQPTPMRYALFSPDRRWVLTIDDKSQLRVFPTSGEAPVPNFPVMQARDQTGAGHWGFPGFTDDSSQIRIKLPDALVTLDVRTGEVLDRDKAGVVYGAMTAAGDQVTARTGLGNPVDALVSAAALPFGVFTPDESAAFVESSGELVDLIGRRETFIPLSVGGVAFSPDGALLACAPHGILCVRRLIREEPYLDLRGPAGGQIALSDDERVFASAGMARFSGGSSLTQAYRVEDGRPAGPVTDLGHQLLCASFLPDGRFLAGSRLEPDGKSGQLQPWDLATGSPSGPALRLSSEPWAIERAPDDSWIAVLSRDGTVWRMDPELESVEVIVRLTFEERDVVGYVHSGHLAFSEDGSRLFANGVGSRTWAIDPGTGEVIYDTGSRVGLAFDIEVAHGLLFAPVSMAKPEYLFDAKDGSVIPLPAEERSFFAIGSKLSRDGRKVLLSGRDRVSVVDLKSGKRLGEPHAPVGVRLPFSDFVADTPWILTAANTEGEPSTLALWDSRTGKRLNPDWPFPDRIITDRVTTQDGRRTILCLADFGHRIILWDEILKHEAWQDGLDPAGRRDLAEIQAGRLLTGGSAVPQRFMQTWHERWEAFDRRHPGHFEVDPSPAERIRWHRNRAVRLAESRPTSAGWHLQRLKALGAEEE